MGIFDFFKKKTQAQKPAVNEQAPKQPDAPAVKQTQPPIAEETSSVQTEAQTASVQSAQEQFDKEKAVQSLRKMLLDFLTDQEEPSLTMEMGQLLWQDAASGFPESGFHWDGAWFKLDLATKQLWADVSTYPDQFGACRESAVSISAPWFNQIAKQYQFWWVYQALETEEDWDQVYDEALKTAIAATEEKIKARDQKELQQHALQIRADQSPDMNLLELTLVLSQRYATRKVRLTNENGQYHLQYNRIPSMSSGYQFESSVLQPHECSWLEMQVEYAVNNPDHSSWQSLPGGDYMDISIRYKDGKAVVMEHTAPLQKYSDLLNTLGDLARYGSKPVKEAAKEAEDEAQKQDAALRMAQVNAIIEEAARKAEEAYAAMERKYQEYLENEGKLPAGFSVPYERLYPSGIIINHTPFKAYLDEIRGRVDALHDRSGISDWLHLDSSVEINAAAASICDWFTRYRQMKRSRSDHKGFHRFSCTMGERIMIVLEDGDLFKRMTRESLQMCQAADIGFCTVLSEGRMFDLIEQKEKELTYDTYPNYHDETYGDWRFTDCENAR